MKEQVQRKSQERRNTTIGTSDRYDDDFDSTAESSYHIAQVNNNNPLATKIKKHTEAKTKGYSWISFNPNKDLLLANSVNNSLYLFNTNEIDLTPPLEFKGHKTSYYCICLLSNPS